MRTKQTPAFASFQLENLILGLLIPEPRHGYHLYQAYQSAFDRIWVVGRSQFYAALADLETSGKLKARVEPQPDHPPRRIFEVTEAGRAQFEAWLREPVTPMRAIRVELIAKLRFYDLLGWDGAGALIDAQVDACLAIRRQWEAEETRLEDTHSDPFLQIVYEFRRQQAGFIISWLEHTKMLLIGKSAR
jgi:DNA-binding PadR family transcriptional regulator